MIMFSLELWARGYWAGYVARCVEESESWQEESARQVYVSGEFVNRPTSAERLAERVATLREGHAAGLHHLVRPACPLCQAKPDAATSRIRRRHGAACQCVDCWPDLYARSVTP